jgi:hypothetical protein
MRWVWLLLPVLTVVACQTTVSEDLCSRLFHLDRRPVKELVERYDLSYSVSVQPTGDRTKLRIQIINTNGTGAMFVASRDGILLYRPTPRSAWYDDSNRCVAWSSNVEVGITFTNNLVLRPGTVGSIDYSGRYFVFSKNRQTFIGLVGSTNTYMLLTNASGTRIFETTNDLVVTGWAYRTNRGKTFPATYFWRIEKDPTKALVLSAAEIPEAHGVLDVDASGRLFLCQARNDLFPAVFVFDAQSRKVICNRRFTGWYFFDVDIPAESFAPRRVNEVTDADLPK